MLQRGISVNKYCGKVNITDHVEVVHFSTYTAVGKKINNTKKSSELNEICSKWS